MMQVFAALNALTPKQKAVLKAKGISGSFPPRELLALLKPIGEFDRMSDQARRGIGCWSAVFLILSIIGLVIATGGGLPWFLGVPLVLGLLGGSAFFFVTRLRLSRNDLSNNFRQIAFPFLAILMEDMEPGEPVALRLDLSSSTDRAKRTGASKAYALGAYCKVIDTYYRDAWFEGSARLADGSTVSWSVVEEITSSARTKRNARGKYKRKTKCHKLCHLEVDVALPCKHYGVDPAARAEEVKLKVRQGEKRTTLRVSRTVKVKANEPFGVKELVDLTAEAFRRAKPVVAGGAS